MAKDPEQLAHQEWLGYVQPVGLVVSIPALLAAQAHINRNIIPDHQRFLDCLPRDARDELIPELRDFAEFTEHVLGWRGSDLELVPAGDVRYTSIEVPLPEYNETLRPTHVVREVEPKDAQHPWMILVQQLPTGTQLDDATESNDRSWQAPPQARFERLLRETRVPIGLLCNATQVRIVYAPRGETSGFATFSVSEMAQIAGRPIFAALHMLLCEERLFSLGEKQRLPAILADSRKYQNVVSTQLAEQVLAALYELVRGFQAANDQDKGELLRAVLAENPNHVYQGLLTVLMRLVFVLYAEDRGLLSSDSIFANYYSLTGLFERLRIDDGRYPDTMDQRYGAWAQLLTLFRLIYEGGSHAELRIPARDGYLFDPDRYNFLEGRPWKTARRHVQLLTTRDEPTGTTFPIPRVSDGVVFRILSYLLILDGERLSYRTLDVEQIGSVYETMMGFELEVAQGRSIALKPKKSHGAPTTINLDALLAAKGIDRAKWLKERADQDVTGQALEALKKASTLEELLAALDKKIAKLVTPNIVSKGAIVLQPSDERRKSGSHYTPRSLTEPIVRTTLKPILEQLSVASSQRQEADKTQTTSPSTKNEELGTKNDQPPTPTQILALKVCDPAMGSGAFLVEACRQLGDELVKSWHIHKCVPKIPPDEDEVLHARRLVAQQCLYGVDKNPMAVDLSKLSLWLATLAKDHPFTFLDHSLRCGDSLVGLTSQQIAAFDWNPPQSRKGRQEGLTVMAGMQARIEKATMFRRRILEAGDSMLPSMKSQLLESANEALSVARYAGNVCISSFFAASSDKVRQQRRDELFQELGEWIRSGFHINKTTSLNAAVASLHGGECPVQPFHWEIEFPEVFSGDSVVVTSQFLTARNKQRSSALGFDAMVGNPPFLGGSRISTNLGSNYLQWLLKLHVGAHGNGDLVAHFFRRVFNLLRDAGTLGLIATKTICQGDTRATGLRWLCTNDATIYNARRMRKWPGVAAVTVSEIHISKGFYKGPRVLDGQLVDNITAFLFDAGGHENPLPLESNRRKTFSGVKTWGAGFLFDDSDTSGAASTTQEMQQLMLKDPRNSERIFPYIGGEDINESPTQQSPRFVICFDEMTEVEAREWPDLVAILESKVKPERAKVRRGHCRDNWWQFEHWRADLHLVLKNVRSFLACSQTSKFLAYAFLPTTVLCNHKVVLTVLETFSAFAILQSRLHQDWAATFGSTLEDRPVYTPSDCFETFPFSNNFESDSKLETIGKEYYTFRAALMVRNNEGLTKTYNRFHDPDEKSPDILKLRELHEVMDRAVFEAYGWNDLAATARCEFLLEYQDDEEEEDGSSLAVSTRRPKKKPWRYRWPDVFRDEVLARLLELNKQRAEEERLAGIAAEKAIAASKKRVPVKKSTRSKPSKSKQTADLFQLEYERFCIRMVVRAWNKPVTRHALDVGLVLMLNDPIRTGLIGSSKGPRKTATRRIVEELDLVLQELQLRLHIEVDNSGPQQILTILSTAPTDDDAAEEDLVRIGQVKQYFEQERKKGNVVESEELIDAKPDLIPVG